MSTLVRQLDTSEDPFELLGDENSGLLLQNFHLCVEGWGQGQRPGNIMLDAGRAGSFYQFFLPIADSPHIVSQLSLLRSSIQQRSLGRIQKAESGTFRDGTFSCYIIYGVFIAAPIRFHFPASVWWMGTQYEPTYFLCSGYTDVLCRQDIV